MQQRGGDDPVAAFSDQASSLRDPRVDDGFLRLALELAEHRVDRQHDPRDDGRDVHIDQRRELIAITALKGTDGNGHA